MTDTDEETLEELRERKMEELKQRAAGDGPSATGGAAPSDERSATDTGGTPDEPVHVEDVDHYRELLAEHDVALVDFYADWCGPCKMLEPIVEDLAAETDAAVLKVDIDALQGLAREMNVQGVPTLLVYADGDVADRVVGVREKEALASMIRAAAS